MPGIKFQPSLLTNQMLIPFQDSSPAITATVSTAVAD